MLTFEKTFDNQTLSYEKVRPTYPAELYDDIFRYRPIGWDSNVLEIGIGTGKATTPFLEKQCRLVALEPGGNLAAFSAEKFKDYPYFLLQNQMLQDFRCGPETFDLIYAATSFHWIPEEYGYKRVYELLKKGGAFARFAYHANKDREREAMTFEIQECYQKYMNASKEPKPYCEEDALLLAEVAKKYGFVDTEYRMYHWTKDFSADDYMEVLKTYPDHMSLEAIVREKLFQGIYKAIERGGGVITVYYTMDLQLARKV